MEKIIRESIQFNPRNLVNSINSFYVPMLAFKNQNQNQRDEVKDKHDNMQLYHPPPIDLQATRVY